MLDTTDFNDGANETYKKNTQNNWNKDPCGANYIDSKLEYLSREYFEDLENKKNSIESFRLDDFQKFNIKDKKCLEIGYGMGTDHAMLSRLGGIMHGIDITEGNKHITEEHLKVFNLSPSELLIGDAEDLPYANESFDFVYSYGVLHHTPDMQKSIDEIYRVLKRGGRDI